MLLDALRRRNLEAFLDARDERVTGLGSLHAERVGLDVLLDLVLELVERVELRGFLREVVVEFRQFLGLHGVDLDLDEGLFAFVIAAFQRAFERGLLAGRQAFEGFVETVEHGARTDLVADALLGVDGLAVDLRVEVDVDEVAVLGRAVRAHEGGEALAQGLKAVVHVFVGDLGLLDLDRHAVKVRQLEIRAALNGRGELELRVVVRVLRQFHDFDLRLRHRTDLLGLQRLRIEVRDGLVHGFAGDGAESNALVDELARHMALTEARNGDLLGDFLASGVEVRLELFLVDGDGELGLGRL